MQSKKILLDSKRTFSSSPIAFLRLIFPDVPFGSLRGGDEKKRRKNCKTMPSARKEKE